MDRIRIVGGSKLNGTIPISGAKNAALPLMIAGLLTEETLILDNVPRHHRAAPPVRPVPAGSGAALPKLLDLVVTAYPWTVAEVE